MLFILWTSAVEFIHYSVEVISFSIVSTIKHIV
jgi:hypothetical protein